MAWHSYFTCDLCDCRMENKEEIYDQTMDVELLLGGDESGGRSVHIHMCPACFEKHLAPFRKFVEEVRAYRKRKEEKAKVSA